MKPLRANLAIALSCALIGAGTGCRPRPTPQARLARVELMPNLPRPYLMREWKKVARDYDALAFDLEAKGQFLPLIWWDTTRHNYPMRGFGLPSYVGSPYQKSRNHHEAINCMAAVVGASLVGIDKSNQRGANFVAMCQRYFNRDNGLNLYLNAVSTRTGNSFWYETYPSILFAQLMDLYPNVGDFVKQLRLSADRTLGAVEALSGPDGIPDFNHTAFDYSTMSPRDNGRWREPDAAAGYAWFLYVSYVRTGEKKYLDGAERCVRFLERCPANPFYEILLPFGVIAAARMNAELGCRYDVEKLLEWCFGPSAARRGWGVIVDRWRGIDVAGLCGSLKDGGGYGFAMNTFAMVGALAPLPRYEPRFARAIGKFVLNAANSARLFYANAHDDAHQTSAAWAQTHDPTSCIAYEGCRKTGRLSDKAVADLETAAGRVVCGDFRATRARREVPRAVEVLEEARDGDGWRLEHIWAFRVKKARRRYFHAFARSEGGAFRFAWAPNPKGPFRPLFTVKADNPSDHYCRGLPADLEGPLYVKAESAKARPAGGKPGRLVVDALFSIYEFDASPFAMGDAVGGHGSPIPTDLALYGASHVGYLAAVVEKTNVEGILRLDLLKTDWHHAPAYPTFLYCNPYPEARDVEVAVGPEPRDIYDAVSHAFVRRGVSGKVAVRLEPESAKVLVLCPAGGRLSADGRRLLVNGIVVDYWEHGQ